RARSVVAQRPRGVSGLLRPSQRREAAYSAICWRKSLRARLSSFPRLRLPLEDEVHHPAAADVAALAPTVLQDLCFRAARFFQGVAEDRHPLERRLRVEGAGEVQHVRRAAGGAEGDGEERVADDLADDGALALRLGGVEVVPGAAGGAIRLGVGGR